MTIDDNTSVYVGNLPYDITEDAVRRVFYIYGAILAVKIINDRAIGGKCYGFVTFANPRSAMQAMKEMDGKTIDGRIIKVNEVKTRDGRANFNHMRSRYDYDRSNDDRSRDFGRYDSDDRKRHQEDHREKSQEQDRHKERSHDRKRDLYVDEERFRVSSRCTDDAEQGHGRKREFRSEKDIDENIVDQRNTNDHKNGDKQKVTSSMLDDDSSQELFSESSSDDEDQGKMDLATSLRKLEALRQERSQMEEAVAAKQRVVSKLQETCQNLEDSLVSARKVTSLRHLQLVKLHKCHKQIRENDERLKKSELKLERLINSTTVELGNNDEGNEDGITAN